MTKKRFIMSSIIIAGLIFSILPLANYIVDPARVLHHDYLLRYDKYHQHELVLKTVYVTEHKNRYDTLVFGSSRGGYMDMSKISKNAFNMSHGFGTASTYLHTLKSIINSGSNVNNVWIGLNDFDIWKDHSEKLPRLIYHNNIIQDVKLYAHWLFTFIPHTIKILQENKQLRYTDEVVAQEDLLARARHQEEHIIKKLKHRNIPAAPLGYTKKFRIDDAIKDIQAIKNLCVNNDINLTVFMYPSYYKTYLVYDQNKIEEFKRKLVSIVDFYDFYDLSSIALDPKNWFEGSHFVPSVGDYIIQNIKEGKHKVTALNIEKRILQTRNYLINMPLLIDEKIYAPHKHTRITIKGRVVFDLYDENSTYHMNDQFELSLKDNILHAHVKHTDPMFILNNTQSDSKQVILLVEIDSPEDSLFQVYYKPTNTNHYSEQNSFKLALHEGNNTFKIVLANSYLNNGLRVDFTRKTGTYKIKKFIIKTLAKK